MQRHVCKNCSNSFTLDFCNKCGEKIFHEHDKSITHFFVEGLHFLTHFEGKFLTTLKTMFLHPGKMSLDYTNGVRKKYFKPLSLFLLLVVIYLVFPLTEGLNMKAVYHTGNFLYGDYAEATIGNLMADKNLNAAQFENIFHIKGEKVSRILLVILIPLTALWFWLFTFRKRPFFFDHVVFSSELNSFYLLWGFLIFPGLLLLLSAIFGSQYTDSRQSQLIFGLITYIPTLIYVCIGSYRFYGFKKWYAPLFGILFAIVHTFIVQFIYKFILFLITIYLIK